MPDILGRASIPLRLAVVVFLVVSSLSGVFALLILGGYRAVSRAGEAETFRLISDIVKWSIEDELELAELSLGMITGDDTVASLFAARDRERLLAYLSPAYENVRDRITRFHFLLPDGVSFLRVHEPERHGDELSALRPMVRRAAELRSAVRGIEKGTSGFGLRAMSPVYAGGVYAGFVEYGMEFGTRFLRTLKTRYEGEYFLYELVSGTEARLLAGTSEEPRCPPEPGTLRALAASEYACSKDCEAAKGICLFPFRTFAGETAGFVLVELHRIPVVESLPLMRTGMTLAAAGFVVTISLIAFFTLRSLLRPLRRIVDQTAAIRREIASGNVRYRGNVSETVADFREIIEAINGIIAALRERETLLQAVVEGIPGAVCYLDRAGTVLWANEHARGRCPGIVGMNLRERGTRCGEIDAETFAAERRLLETVLRTGAASSAVIVRRGQTPGADESEEYWEHAAVPVFSDGTSVMTNLVLISQEVTKKIETENSLKRLNETLERCVEEEVRKRKEQEVRAFQQSRLASIGELAAGIAHELNQPLGSISFSVENLFSRFLQGSVNEEYIRSKIESVSFDLERIRRIIDHVRLFARSRPDEYCIDFSAAQCVENAVGMVGVQYATHFIDIVTELPSDLPPLYGNPYQYEEVILNLLSNAKDALEDRMRRETESRVSDPEPALITVSLSEEAGSVVLTVRDNGTGIPPGVRDRVFDPFFTTKKPDTGTGLGLSISYGIVRGMGGGISIDGSGSGAAFRVAVPVSEACRCGN